MSNNFQKLDYYEIQEKLISIDYDYQFTEGIDDDMAYNEIEWAIEKINIQVDIDLAWQAIEEGHDLIECIVRSQVQKN